MSQLPPPLGTDGYLSLEDGPEVEIRIKGSTFLGQAFGVASIPRAAGVVGGVRKRHHDATHHCSAWRIGNPEASVERSDDDGEPSGTAGVPILGALHRAELFDALVVVTRYFGGTKLGTGGLVRAYADAARVSLDATARRPVFREATLTLTCRYEDVGAVEAVLAREGGRIRGVERTFGGSAAFAVTVLRSQADDLRAILVESTSGRATIAGIRVD